MMTSRYLAYRSSVLLLSVVALALCAPIVAILLPATPPRPREVAAMRPRAVQ